MKQYRHNLPSRSLAAEEVEVDPLDALAKGLSDANVAETNPELYEEILTGVRIQIDQMPLTDAEKHHKWNMFMAAHRDKISTKEFDNGNQ